MSLHSCFLCQGPATLCHMLLCCRPTVLHRTSLSRFQKVLDTVCHQILFSKQKHYQVGVSKCICEIVHYFSSAIKSVLTEKKQNFVGSWDQMLGSLSQASQRSENSVQLMAALNSLEIR